MTLDSRGRLFTSSTDGLVKIFENPRSVEFSQELIKSFDELLCVVAVGEDIYTGDDKGVVRYPELAIIHLHTQLKIPMPF